jgi:hypothetical protein
MPDGKKPLDPALLRIIDAIAGIPDTAEGVPSAENVQSKRQYRKADNLTIRWHVAETSSPGDQGSRLPPASRK